MTFFIQVELPIFFSAAPFHHFRLVYRDTPVPLPSGNNFPDSTTYIRHSFFDSRATDTQAMLIEFDGELPFAVLSFRGTEQKIKDIVTDLNFETAN